MDALVTWLRGFGLEQDHVEECEIKADNQSIANFGLTSLFEEFTDVAAPPTSSMPDNGASLSDHESEIEVATDEANNSEDDWADLEWEWDWDRAREVEKESSKACVGDWDDTSAVGNWD